MDKNVKIRNLSRREVRLREEKRLRGRDDGNPAKAPGARGSGGGGRFKRVISDMCAVWRATRSGLRNQMRRVRQGRTTMAKVLEAAARGIA